MFIYCCPSPLSRSVAAAAAAAAIGIVLARNFGSAGSVSSRLSAKWSDGHKC